MNEKQRAIVRAANVVQLHKMTDGMLLPAWKPYVVPKPMLDKTAMAMAYSSETLPGLYAKQQK